MGCRTSEIIELPRVVALLLVLGVVATHSAEAEHPEHDASKTVVAVVPKDFPPHYQLDQDGRPAGFAIDMMNAIAGRAGLDVKYVVKDHWEEVNAALARGEADIIPNQGITAARDRLGTFTAPMETFDIVIFVRSGNTRIKSVGDLAGHTVATVATNVAVKILQDTPGVTLDIADHLSEAVFALLSGNVDALVYPEPVIWSFARRIGVEERLRKVGAPLAEVKRAIFVRPYRADLVAVFDNVIARFVHSDEYQSIFEKWYGAPMPYWTPVRIVSVAGGLAVVAVLLILLVSNRRFESINRKLRQSVTELKAVQERLHTREQSYRGLYDHSPIAYLSVRATDAVITNCNPAAAELTGYAPDDLREMPVFEIYADTPDGLQKAKTAFARFRRGEKVDQEPLQIQRPDGSVIWVSLSVNAIRNEAGAIVESRSVLTDISALKSVETDLRNSERRFREIAEAAPVGIFHTDATGAVVFANNNFGQLVERPREALLGSGWQEALFPDDRERVMSMWRQSVETGKPLDVEFRFAKPDGRVVWVIARASAEMGAEFKTSDLIGSITDITEQKLAELSVAQVESRLRFILDHVPDVIVLYGRDLRIQYISAATTALTGLPTEHFIGKRDADIWPSTIYETFLPTLKQARDDGVTSRTSVSLNLTRDTPQFLEITCVPIKGEDGVVTQILGITHDVTALTESVADLAASEERNSLAMKAANDGLWDWNLLTDEVYYSPRWKSILGYQDREIPDEINEWERRVHPDDLPAALEAVDACIKAPTAALEVEFRMRHKNGSWVDILARGSVMNDVHGTPNRFIGTHIDISQRKAQEREILKLNAVRETVSQCNSALVRVSDESKLLQEMCDILVRTREYDLAWVGYVDVGEGAHLSRKAVSGNSRGFIDHLTTAAVADGAVRGPEEKAVHTGKNQVVSDISRNRAFKAWAAAAKKFAFRTSIALPLSEDGNVFGVLGIYSPQVEKFDDDEVRVLDEFRQDLTYGISMIRARQARDEARSTLSETLFSTIHAIAMTVEKRDPYTAGHQRRVANLSVFIARELGWPESRIEGLQLGATIHDIGKIYVPAEILNRPGKLTAHEFGMIKSHTEVGYDIIAGVNFPWPVGEMVRQHHERIDGTGYPDGLTGDEIVPEAKIIAVADVVEAITSHRPYRPSLGIEVGIEEIIRGRGTAYDPEIVDVCVNIIQEEGFRWGE